MPEAPTIADESPVIVSVSVPALVVRVMPPAPTNVTVSSAVSALILVCPDTAICLNAVFTFPAPPPPPPHLAEDVPVWARDLIAAVNQRPAKKTRQDEPRGRSTERRGSGDRGNRRMGSPSPGQNLVVGLENRCFHCGSDKHTRKECDASDKMMKDANVGKPKAEWKPPSGYKSALGKARDLQKAKNARDKKKINAFTHEEVMSEDSDSDMSEAGFSIAALRPLPKIRRKPVARTISAINRFQGLDEHQEYDSDVLASLNSWAHEVRVAPSRPKKSAATDSKIHRTVNYINGPKKINDEPNNSVTESKQSQRAPVPTVNVDDEPTIVIQSEKDMKMHEAAVMKLMAALPSNPKKLQRAARRVGSIELEDDEILAMGTQAVFSMPSMLKSTFRVMPLNPLKERTKPDQQKQHAEQFSRDWESYALPDLLMVKRSMSSGTT